MPQGTPRILGRHEIPPSLARRAEEAEPGVYVTSHGRRILVLICAGEQRTAGFELRPRGPLPEQLAAGKLEVELVGPPRGAMVAQVLTYPFLAVDAGEGPVRLRQATLVTPEGNRPLPINFWGEMPS